MNKTGHTHNLSPNGMRLSMYNCISIYIYICVQWMNAATTILTFIQSCHKDTMGGLLLVHYPWS